MMQGSEPSVSSTSSSSSHEIDASSYPGPPTLDASSRSSPPPKCYENYNQDAVGSHAINNYSKESDRPSPDVYRGDFFFITPKFQYCELCSPPETSDWQSHLQKSRPQCGEQTAETQTEEDSGIYVLTSNDANSVVSGITLSSDFYTSPPVIGSLLNATTDDANKKAILSPVSEYENKYHASSNSSLENNDDADEDEEESPQIKQLSRLIALQEELVEKTRQMNKRKKIIIYSNIILIFMVALAVGLAFGLGRSNYVKESAADPETPSTQQNISPPLPKGTSSPSMSPEINSNVENSPAKENGDPSCQPLEVYASLSDADKENWPTTTKEPPDGKTTWSMQHKLSNAELGSGIVDMQILYSSGNRGVILDNTLCLPDGIYTFQVDRTPAGKNDANYLSIIFEVRVLELEEPVGGDDVTILLRVDLRDEQSNVSEFALTPLSKSSSPTYLPSTASAPPTKQLTTLKPSVLPSMYPSIGPTEEVLLLVPSSSPSASLEATASPTLKPIVHGTIPPTAAASCQTVSFEILTDDYGSDISVSLIASAGNLDATIDNAVGTFVFHKTGLQSNDLFQYQECLPMSEYTFVITDAKRDGFCCGGYYSLKVESNRNLNYADSLPKPQSYVLRGNETLFGALDVTTFSLPFNSSHLHPLEVEIIPTTENLFSGGNGKGISDLSWEIWRDGQVEFTHHFSFYSNMNSSIFRERKYVTAGEFQFIGHNVSQGEFKLLLPNQDEGKGDAIDIQVLASAVKKVNYHSIIFPLPFDKAEYHLFEIYFETPTSYGLEIHWEVRNHMDEVILMNHRAYCYHESYMEAKYLVKGFYELNIYDFTSQGLGDFGQFRLYLDGVILDSFDSLTSDSWYLYNFSFSI